MHNREGWRLYTAVGGLSQIGTPDAEKVLEQLATGHEDARSTKAAKRALTGMKER
jgi:hypothetical protein